VSAVSARNYSKTESAYMRMRAVLTLTERYELSQQRLFYFYDVPIGSLLCALAALQLTILVRQ
jgi:hypothetical protein